MGGFPGLLSGRRKTKPFSENFVTLSGKTNCSKFKALVIPDHMCLSKNICIHDINSRFPFKLAYSHLPNSLVEHPKLPPNLCEKI
jgi:hypothetical protein